jgi:hypothetical protein
MTEPQKLSEEDLQRVAEYLNSPVHQFERKPFHPWRLLLGLTLVTTFFTIISLWYAWSKGVLALTWLTPFLS